MRWSQLGFGRTSSTSRAQETPRNLMGFKDGTNNIKLEDGGRSTEHVWVRRTRDPPWLRGGTYLVTRRIRMLIEVWDRATLDDQEQTIGRAQGERRAARPGGRVRRSTWSNARSRTSRRRARPPRGAGRERRYAASSAAATRSPTAWTRELGQLDAGLFFIGFQNDPAGVRRRCSGASAAYDALNEYIKHTGSALFACPPGARPGGYVGETLLG